LENDNFQTAYIRPVSTEWLCLFGSKIRGYYYYKK